MPASLSHIKRMPYLGEAISFYPSGRKDGGDVNPAFCVRVDNDRGIVSLSVLQLGGLLGRRGIWHVDDPRFEENPELRAKNGAWDFAEKPIPISGVAKIDWKHEAARWIERGVPAEHIATMLEVKAADVQALSPNKLAGRK
ncbi:MAG: hypothetical protein MK165_14150 [Pirellulaceae bacterium]|nr:hypothetical protein [Pirellulaceae bacterium]